MSTVTFKNEVMYPSKWLKAADLVGKDVTLTIARVVKELVKMRKRTDRTNENGEEECWIIYFAEGRDPKKGWILNREKNPHAIRDLYGAKADDWIGKRITLYPTTTNVGGEIKPCIRVRPTAPPDRIGTKASPKREPEPMPPQNEPEYVTDPIPYDGPTEEAEV
jgi:hypothetical protein